MAPLSTGEIFSEKSIWPLASATVATLPFIWISCGSSPSLRKKPFSTATLTGNQVRLTAE
jgi:hypothetical protein